MLRLGFRLVGVLLLAAAFAALVIDGTRTIADGALALTSLDETGQALFPARYALLKPWAEHIKPWLWDPVLVTLMALPTFVVAGVIGGLLVAATGRRRAQIGEPGR